jgi:hypothetical protein
MTTSSEMLREAARVMRERANAATASPWTNKWRAQVESRTGTTLTHAAFKRDVDAEHIAAWHPAVALAVADWLDHEADTFDFIGDIFASPAGQVAAAYLDREPDPRDHADEETTHG